MDDSAVILEAMKRREVRRILVANNGKLVGVIAQADIATSKQISKAQVAEVVEKVSEPAHPTR
jgi:predicted transcriptional regulator